MKTNACRYRLRIPGTTRQWVCVGLIASSQLVQLPAQATEALIMGGGSSVLDSHTGFQYNVRWVQDVLNDQQVDVVLYFNDGNAPQPDTFYFSDSTSTDKPQALIRVFGAQEARHKRYANNTLEAVNGGTQLDSLQSELISSLASHQQGELLMVFSGHGIAADETTASSSMALWNDTRLSARQLQEMISRNNRAVRFVFSQSYSGDFHELAYAETDGTLALAEPTHCGFTSGSAYTRAETDTHLPSNDDYRDYSAYFFSAISGYEHNGEIISRFADFDRNGEIGLREAHLFSFEESHGIDLPLSTSEHYLRRWQPWYLRWQPAHKRLPNNEYTRIFRDLANRLDIDLTSDAARAIRDHLTIVANDMQVLELLMQLHEQDIHTLQTTLKRAATDRWPALADPFSPAFQQLVADNQLDSINEFLANSLPEYSQLVALEEQLQTSRTLYLDKQRENVQFQKLLRLRHLALLKQQLREHGSKEQLRDYQSLLRCEEAPLHPSIRTVNVTEDTTQ